MKVIDLRTGAEVPGNVEKLLGALAPEALADAKLASQFDTRAAFGNNMNMTTSTAPANDSNIMFEVIRNDMVDAQAELVAKAIDNAFEARIDATQSDFKSTMEIVKTITTKDGKVRGFVTNFEADPKVIKVNFKPNRHNTLGNTGS